MTVLVWLECFFIQKMKGLWHNFSLEGSRWVIVMLFCKSVLIALHTSNAIVYDTLVIFCMFTLTKYRGHYNKSYLFQNVKS